MEENLEYLTPPEAAKFLRCTPALLAKYRSVNAGPPFLRLGRLVRYQRAELAGWLESSRVVPTQSTSLRASGQGGGSARP